MWQVKHMWPGDVVDRAIAQSLHFNLMCAVCCAAILLNTKTCSEKELFTKITSLSYLGDVRMSVAENPHKVENIVSGQANSMHQFSVLYNPIFQKLSIDGLILLRDHHQNREIEFCGSPTDFFSCLPAQIRGEAYPANLPDFLTKKLLSRNNTSSRNQSLKGIVTAGFGKSIYYSFQKLKKRFS